MAANMHSGDDRWLCFTAGCWEVSRLCGMFTPPQAPMSEADWRDSIGTFSFPPETVMRANLALADEWDPTFTTLDQEQWAEVRRFLRQTAEAGAGISGSD